MQASDFAPKNNYAEDDNDYVFTAPMMRVWHTLTDNSVKYIEHTFPRFNNKSNTALLERVHGGENIYWTPATLSFMRSNVTAKRILSIIIPNIIKLYPSGVIDQVVDATANIGGESIQMALSGVVKSVKSYEPDARSFEMLKNNIGLYSLENVITPINTKFDYDIQKGAMVLLDPPFQSSTNIGNFNMSIEKRNLHYIIRDIFKKGATTLLLNTPRDYVINTKFCRDHSLCAVCYRFGSKNVKIFIIMPLALFRRAYGGGDFASYEVRQTARTKGIPTDEEEYKLLYTAHARRIK